MELISRIVLQILALELPLDDKNFNLDRIVADELQSRYSALTTCAIIIAQSQPNGPADVWQIYALSPDIAYGVDITLCGACPATQPHRQSNRFAHRGFPLQSNVQ